MASGTFTCNALSQNSKRAYKNTKKTCKSFKLDESNVGTTAVNHIFLYNQSA